MQSNDNISALQRSSDVNVMRLPETMVNNNWHLISWLGDIDSLRPGQNGRHFADDIFNCIFLNENVLIPIKISLKFVPNGPINNIPALV